jgi:chromosome segregation protein
LVSSELDELRQRLFGFEAAESKLRALQNLAQQRISLLGQQQPFIKQGEVEALKNKLVLSEQELSDLESNIDSTAGSLKELEQKRLLASEALSKFEADILRDRSEAELVQTERSKLANSISVLESRIQGFDSQASSLQESLAAAQLSAFSLEVEQEALGPKAGSVSDSVLRERYEASQKAEQEARLGVDNSREALHALERERDAIAAKHAALGLTLEQVDGSVEVIKADLLGIRGLLAESVVIETGYEVAIAATLGSMADAILAESRQQAVTALRYLKNEGLGRAEFLIGSGGQEPIKRIEAHGLVAAQSVVRAPKRVIQALEAVYIATDLDQALAALEKDPDLKVITKDGDFVSAFSVRGGGTKLPSKLELIAERESAAKRLKSLATQIDLGTLELEKTKLFSSKTQEGVRAALSKLQEHDAELAARAQRVGRVIAQVGSAKNDVIRLEKDVSGLLESKTGSENELAKLLAALEAMPKQQTVLANEDERALLIGNLDGSRQLELEVRISIGTFAERKANAAKEVAVLRGRVNEAIAANEHDQKANEQKGLQLSAAQATLSILPNLIALAEKLGAETRVQVREREAKRAQQAERLGLLRSQAGTLEARYNELNQSVHEVEMRNHELKLNLANLSEKTNSGLAISVEVLLTDYPVDEASLEELEKNLRQAESKFSQLGAFNPLALEEFAALEQRHQYLSEQLEDLAKARADLMGIIRDLDGKMQSIFAAAFEDTKVEFEKIFPILFPGGTGSISLTEPDDLLQTGLEVSVRPAGKRIERMSLLSGGERSLAAVALLIAIFKARPSPFYVLDEVEAALDDSNLGRLLEVIDSLRKSSQLIIVTHQKRTMEIADALYGISMRQDGMSAVVGQRLEKQA